MQNMYPLVLTVPLQLKTGLIMVNKRQSQFRCESLCI